MSKNEKKIVKRFLSNWRGLISRNDCPTRYAEAYFIGGWTVLNDRQVAWVLDKLTEDEIIILLSYPIWM